MQVVQEDTKKTPLYMEEIITNMDLIKALVLLEVHMMEKGRALATLALRDQIITKVIRIWRVIKEKVTKT